MSASFTRNSWGIRFADYLFTEPIPLDTSLIPYVQGLFVVLIFDFTWAPRQFQPLFFGEVGRRQGSPIARNDYLRWLRTAAGKQLYLAICPIPATHVLALPGIKNHLVDAYDPVCNREPVETGLLSADVLSRLDTFQEKQKEHDALIRLMVAAFGHMVQPPPEPKRRAGFLPH